MQTYPSMPAWRTDVLALPDQLAWIDRTASDGGLRTALFAVWRMLALAPPTLIHRYAQVPESQVREAASKHRRKLRDPDFGLALSAGLDDLTIVRRLAGLLRALEWLIEQTDEGGLPVDPEAEWRVSFQGEDAFHIPLSRLSWRITKDPEKDVRPFDQRGLLSSRLVPTTVDGCAVRLVRPSRIRTKSDAECFGAVLFAHPHFQADIDDEGFVVTEVSASGLSDDIAAACDQSHADGCLAAMFPELMIDMASRDQIGLLLEQKPWLDSRPPTRPPSVVVAGSWHEPIDGGHANVAVVFDGDGVELLRHHKRYAYRDKDWGPERIVPGEELAILILEEGLFAFGICLDFCHRGFDTPYGRLDVDFVLVPSCGDGNTMDEHISTAKTLNVRRNMRSFVVQQAYPTIPEGRGFVLKPGSIPTPGHLGAGAVMEAGWSVSGAKASTKR